MRNGLKAVLAGTATCALVGAALSGPGAVASPDAAPPAISAATEPTPLVDLMGGRDVAHLGNGMSLVTEGDGSFGLVGERANGTAYKAPLGAVPAGFGPAVAMGPGGIIYLLTGAEQHPEEAAARRLAGKAPLRLPATGATLYRWHLGMNAPRPVADIGAYQAEDVDPYDLEDLPGDSNPYGLAALRGGGVLVADAAGNDLLRVRRNGVIETVARIKPRTVRVPEGFPDIPEEEGGPLPPAGTPMPAESVPTGVTVGPDGAWYVGELRGFPGTPGTSQIWRIRPGTTDAVCDPARPRRGACTRWADGLTSISDLSAGRRALYATELSKLGWMQLEFGNPDAAIGSLVRVRRLRGGVRTVELARDQLALPGGVAVGHDGVYVAGPVFGPGSLVKVPHGAR